jgi:hypothetical protein
MNDETSDHSDIASMLDSIEEAIGADISWSSLPPPITLEVEAPEVSNVPNPPPAVTVAPTDDVHREEAHREEAHREEAHREEQHVELAPRDAHPFHGISSALRTYPDPAPRTAGVGGLVHGSARDVMNRFKWGGT